MSPSKSCSNSINFVRFNVQNHPIRYIIVLIVLVLGLVGTIYFLNNSNSQIKVDATENKNSNFNEIITSTKGPSFINRITETLEARTTEDDIGGLELEEDDWEEAWSKRVYHPTKTKKPKHLKYFRGIV